MRQHADRLADNGYQIIPIIPRTKRPGFYSPSGGWGNFRNWNTFKLSPDDVEKWKTWPDVGISVVCGNVCAVDIDILDSNLSQAVAASIMADLGNTGAIRIGRAPKKLLVYRGRPLTWHAWDPARAMLIPLSVLAPAASFQSQRPLAISQAEGFGRICRRLAKGGTARVRGVVTSATLLTHRRPWTKPRSPNEILAL
jgi:hypothetical protein